MSVVHRKTDTNTKGGAVDNTSPNSTVFANNLLVAIDGSNVTNHDGHNNQVTAGGCSTVFAHNISVNHAGNVDTCGHARQEFASPDVFVCAFRGFGVNIDFNPPYIPVGAIDPVNQFPMNSQQIPPTGYETNTLADVHVYELNDDSDGTLGGPPPLTAVNQNASILEEDPTPAPVNPPPVQNCSLFDSLPLSFNWKTFYGSPAPIDFDAWANDPGTYPEAQLSPNFTVGDLTINTAVSFYEFTTNVTQASGLSQKQILQNMCHLAKTILEPMLSTYGSFVITSGFRNKSDSSQHSLGQAIDIQFSGLNGAGYFNRAQEIRDSFNFDQFILEWFGRNPWYHISSNLVSHRNSVLTQVSHNSYQSGLKRIGV